MAFKIKRFIPASPLTMPDPDPKPKKAKRGAIKRSSSRDESGRTTVTVTQDFSTEGRKTNKTYKQLAAEGGDVAAAKKFNADKSISKTTTYSYGGNKGAGIKTAEPQKPKADLSKKPSIKAPSARDIHKARLGVKKMEYQDWKEEKIQKFKQDRAHKKPYTEAERQRDIKIAKKNRNKRKRKNLFSFKLPTIRRSDITISEAMNK